MSPPDPSSPIWHPFTQHALTPDAIFVSQGEGAWLETKNGRMLDAISSWWVITHGHRHPKIVKAIQQQADALDQVIFAGFTHQPAEDLARALVEIVPRDLTRVFYSDSGSTAVEVALKMALGFWKNCGKARSRVIALEHAYHGDTIGTMSAGARGVFNAAYAPLLFDVVRLPFPAAGRERETLEQLKAAAANAAVLIVEPLILGAGGMMIYSADFLRAMASVCRETGTLLIADEAMTGFGRTGTLFACEQAAISPDILCLAKGLSGGSLPLAATLCREEIFAAHYSTDRSRTFFHSSSFTANPIACAAARANLEIWRDEPVLERIARLAQAQEDRLARFRDHRCFENVRRIGTITALDLKVADAGYLAHVAPDLIQFFHAKGILLRPLGNTIYVLPPYCVTAAELDLVYDAILEAAGKFG